MQYLNGNTGRMADSMFTKSVDEYGGCRVEWEDEALKYVREREGE